MWFPLLSMLFCAAPAPADPGPSLFAIENVKGEGGVVHTRSLVRITLAADGRPAKTTLVTLDQGFFGHFGGVRLVDDRFVVTRHGGVIDLATKKVVNDETLGELLGVEKGKVVYRIENTRRESGIFAFDLTTSRVEKMTAPGHWALPGVKSPQKTQSIEAKSDGTIVLHSLDGTEKELSRDHSIEYSPLSSTLSQSVPCLWLDDVRVSTQKSNGKLVILDVKGESRPLVDIPNVPAGLSRPRLWLDAKHRLIYHCDQDYLIDLQRKKWSALDWYALGHGFEASAAEADGGVRRVRHNGKHIGQWVMSPHDAATAPGRIAFPFVRPGQNLGQPDGVALWDQKSGQSQTVIFWPDSLVGWGPTQVRLP
jgi:hypothetical protein